MKHTPRNHELQVSEPRSSAMSSKAKELRIQARPIPPVQKSTRSRQRASWRTFRSAMEQRAPSSTRTGPLAKHAIVDSARHGLDKIVHRSSPDGHRAAVARPPTVAAERIHHPWPSPANVFSVKDIKSSAHPLHSRAFRAAPSFANLKSNAAPNQFH